LAVAAEIFMLSMEVTHMVGVFQGMGHRCLVAALILAGLGSLASGDELDQVPSLRLADENVDFFAASVKLGEQANRWMESRLVRELRSVPYVQKAIEKFREQWGSDDPQLSIARNMVENPVVKDWLQFGLSLISDEVFVLGDQKVSEFFYEFSDLNDDLRALTASLGPDEAERFFEEFPKERLDAVPVPTFIVGFQQKDRERGAAKVNELGGLLRLALGGIPWLAGFEEGLERVEDERGVRLEWTMEASMLPWEDLPFLMQSRRRDFEETQLIVDKLEELIKDRQIVLTLGQLDDYFVFALSESTDDIHDLGQGTSLAKHPTLQPLRDHADQPITAVSYLSDEYAKAAYEYSTNHFFSRSFAPQYYAAEKMFGEVPADFQSIPDDLAWLDDQIAEHIPERQGATSLAWLTDSGAELRSYNRTKSALFDSSQPLAILDHVGADPMAMLAFRLQYHPEYFVTSRRIVQKIKSYLDSVPGLGLMDEETEEQWRFVLEDAWPFLVELADLWEEEFLPAMRDGQHAWVLQGGNLSSHQWIKGMPRSDKPLPFPEMATVTGLSNSSQLSNAFQSFFDLMDRIVDRVRTLEPEKIPADYHVPRPVTENSKFGDQYSLALPNSPLSEALSTRVLLTEQYMFSGYSGKQIDDLATGRKLAIGAGVIQADRPASAVAHLDFGRIIDFAKPWIVHWLDTDLGDLSDVVIEEEQWPEMTGQDVLDLWTAFGKAGRWTSVSTVDENGWNVTRTVATE
jgi:hypothetical protein